MSVIRGERMWSKVINFVAWFMIVPWSFILYLYIKSIWQFMGRASVEQRLLKAPVHLIKWWEFFFVFGIEGLFLGVIFYV